MQARRKKPRAVPLPDRLPPADAHAGGLIRDSLELVESTGVLVDHVDLISGYLSRYPDSMLPVEAACARVAHEFGSGTQVKLGLHRAIEEPDEYLLLNVRAPTYSPDFYSTLRRVREQLEESWPGIGEHLLVSTDFGLPG